jgi:hypothetical protein
MMSRLSVVLMAAIVAGQVLTSPRAHARWWGTRAPVDYEECADVAEQAATREAKAAALIDCNAKFAGRRKPGGGYTYFDFMQNRSFDIAGSNPTREEQKRIDEKYTEFLDRERQSNIAEAFAAKQQQLELRQATLRSETEKIPAPTPPRNKPSVAVSNANAAINAKRLKASNCADHSFSCDWPQLSEKLNDLKKALFGSSSSNSSNTPSTNPSSKAKRS